jgi:hypothetical protein
MTVTGLHCPAAVRELMCDQPALYLVDGTALCRTHARDAISDRHDVIAYEVTIRTEAAPGVHLFHPSDVRIVRRAQ